MNEIFWIILTYISIKTNEWLQKFEKYHASNLFVGFITDFTCYSKENYQRHLKLDSVLGKCSGNLGYV